MDADGSALVSTSTHPKKRPRAIKERCKVFKQGHGQHKTRGTSDFDEGIANRNHLGLQGGTSRSFREAMFFLHYSPVEILTALHGARRASSTNFHHALGGSLFMFGIVIIYTVDEPSKAVHDPQ